MKIVDTFVMSVPLVLLLTGCNTSEKTTTQDAVLSDPVFADNNMSGKMLFLHEFDPSEGLGPHFNGTSCTACHALPSIGGVGDDKDDIVLRIGFLENGIFSDLTGEGGPSARAHSVTDDGYYCEVSNGIGQNVNVVSLRSPLSLFGLGIVNSIPDYLIEAEAVDKGFGIHGKVNKIGADAEDYRVGKFGWKAQKASLLNFTAEAFRNEIGMTNPLFSQDNFNPNTIGLNECDGFNKGIEISTAAIKKVSDFIATLPIKNAGYPDLTGSGFEYFKEAKCHLCHKPSYVVDDHEYFLFSDFLLHDMGDGLNDNFVQGYAQGMDWRTTPLHGLGFREKYLHDLRTYSINDAIRAHRGEANQSMTIYSNFSEEKKNDLIDFLNTL